MAQLCLYLDDSTMSRLRSESEEAQCSLSRYVSSLINSEKESAVWPNDYWNIYGALSDSTFQVPTELKASADGALPAF